MLMETCPSGSDANCSLTPAQIDGEEFLKHLLRVNFNSSTGPFSLNENGDTEGMYFLTNLQYSEGRYHFVDIGKWNSRQGLHNRLQLDDQIIQWPGGPSDQEFPRSSCRKICSARQITIPLKQKCCWGCEMCDDNSIILNGTECMACPSTFWPNEAYNKCVAIVPDTVSLKKPIATVIFSLACVGIFMSCVTASGLVYYRHEQLVKTTSRELSIINLLGLTTTFIAVIPLLQPPSTLTCPSSEALISICFTLTYVPTLLKVNRIYRIFRAGKRSVRRPRFVTPRHQLTLAGILIFIQVSLYSMSPKKVSL